MEIAHNKNETILISGGGVVGLTLGIRLKQLGLDPCVVEKQLQLRPLLKGEYFQPQGVALLQKLGLLDQLLESGGNKIHVLSRTLRNPFTKKAERAQASYNPAFAVNYGLIVTHEGLLSTLRNEYSKLGGRFRGGVHVKNLNVKIDHYQVELSTGETVKADIFVGADGSHSATRKMAGLTPLTASCDRGLIGALVSNLKIPEGEFYVEETDQGVIYAFTFKDGLTRAYVGMNSAEMPLANKDKSAFLLDRLESISLPHSGAIEIEGPIFIMPTLDSMLTQISRESGIWIGDAAGTVDPLGGHGMSVALNDSMRVAQAIYECSARPDQAKIAFVKLQAQWRFDFLHARFIGQLIGPVLMAKSWPFALFKWITVKRHIADPVLRQYFTDLFSGMNRERISLIDVLYLFGLVSTRLRLTFQKLGLDRFLANMQNAIVVAPIALLIRRNSL